MFTKVNSVGIQGIEGVLIGVEADVGDGLPGFSMVVDISFSSCSNSGFPCKTAARGRFPGESRVLL